MNNHASTHQAINPTAATDTNCSSIPDYARLKRLLEAHAISPEQGANAEIEIVNDLISREVLEADRLWRRQAHPDVAHLTAFQATEALSDVLDTYLPANKKRRYDPKLVDAAVVTDVWSLRQTIDSLGMPYDRYIDMAITYIGKPHGRAPRLSQFSHVDVVTHVVTEWSKRS